MKLQKSQPMKKEQKQVNQLQAKYLDSVIAEARRAMLKKLGVDDVRYYRGDRENDPAWVKKLRKRLRDWEKKEEARCEAIYRKRGAPLEKRINELRAAILFAEPKEALAMVKALAREAGLNL